VKDAQSGERSTTIKRTTGYGLFSQETHNSALLLRLVLNPELATEHAEGLVVMLDLNNVPLFPAKYMAANCAIRDNDLRCQAASAVDWCMHMALISHVPFWILGRHGIFLGVHLVKRHRKLLRQASAETNHPSHTLSRLSPITSISYSLRLISRIRDHASVNMYATWS
jgi:hypothetical protein